MAKVTESIPRRVRGTLEVQGGDKYVFTPKRDCESTQTNVVTVGNAKMYDTTGKSPKKVVYLKCAANVPDIRAELYRQVKELTEGWPTEAIKPAQGSVCLHRSETARLYVDEDNRNLIGMVTLPIRKGADYTSEMIANVSKMSQSIAVNRELINDLVESKS